MNARSRVAVLGGGLAAVLALSACGGADTSTTGSGGAPAPAVEASEISPEHNEADVRFAQQMLPHHEQAIEMTDLAVERAESEGVKGPRRADQRGSAAGDRDDAGHARGLGAGDVRGSGRDGDGRYAGDDVASADEGAGERVGSDVRPDVPRDDDRSPRGCRRDGACRPL